MPSIYLRLLGPAAFRPTGGELAPIPGKKVQALVAYLALEDRWHSRDALAALMWGDMAEDRARHNLRQALSKLRRVVGEILELDEDRVRLRPGAWESDVDQLERAIERGEIERVLELQPDELLAGISLREDAFDEWLRDRRLALRGRVCSLVDAEIERALAAESFGEGTGALIRQRLQLDPACEAAHRAMMILHWRTGRRTDAIRHFQVCESALGEHLGVAPARETLDLLERIRSDATAGVAEAKASATARAPEQGARSEPPSVAVMAFENLAADDDRYFADGISEDIITALSHFSSLTVISRAASFRLRESDLGPRDIGEHLGADYIVQGSVRRAAHRVRITVQLVDAASEKQLWGQRFDRDLEDVFVVQDEVSSTIVSTIAGRVEAARTVEARRLPPERLDAYDWVLRGKYHHHLGTAEDCNLAIEHFRSAIERDQDYALGHAWLACGLGQKMFFAPDEKPQLLDAAEEAAEKGRRLDEEESECHRILAQVFLLRHNLKRSLFHARRSVELNPNDDRSLAGLGEVLAYMGEAREGARCLRRAMRLNRYHPESYHFHLGRALYHAGEYQQAIDALARIARPQLRECVFTAAAAGRLGDRAVIDSARDEVRSLAPDFDAARFLRSLPYQDEALEREILDGLAVAGL